MTDPVNGTDDLEREYPELRAMRIAAERTHEQIAREELAINAILKGAAPLSGFELGAITPVSWQGRRAPERPWFINGWIPDFAVTSLYGDGGTGKSLLSQMLLTACALGQPFLGLKVDPRRSVGIFCEDREDELWRRQEAINRHYGCEMDDLNDMALISRVGKDNIMMHFDLGTTGQITEFSQRVLVTWFRDTEHYRMR